MAKPDLPSLQAALSVARHKNFRRAAAELGVSPSAVSHTVSDLEDRLGIRLFNRTTRSVSLTAAGDDFVRRVQPALAQLAYALDAINQHRQVPAGLIRVNTSAGAAKILLEPLFLPFLESHPDVQLELVSEDGLIDIVDQEFDVGIRLIESVPKDMVAIACSGELQLIVVASPRYTAKYGVPITPEDLYKHTCLRLRFPNGALYKWEFAKAGVEIEIDVPGQLTISGNNDLALQAAIAGSGIAFVAEQSAREYLEQGTLVQLLGDWTPTFPGLAIFYPRGRPISAAVRAFIDFAKCVEHWPS